MYVKRCRAVVRGGCLACWLAVRIHSTHDYAVSLQDGLNEQNQFRPYMIITAPTQPLIAPSETSSLFLPRRPHPPLPRHSPTAYYQNVTGIATFGDKGALDHRRLQSSSPPSSFSPFSPLSTQYHEQTNTPAARNLAASAAAAGSESGAAASSGHDCSAFDPHHCDIELLHLLEDLHMILFLVVIIYFAYSLWLLRRSVHCMHETL